MKKNKLHKPKSYSIKLEIFRIWFGWKPNFVLQRELLWKDKFGTPRVEILPHLIFNWLWLDLYVSKGGEDEWEWWLWLHKYNKGNLREALSSWPWRTIHSEEEFVNDVMRLKPKKK